MFNRLRKLNSIGNAIFDSFSIAGELEPVFPPYGTLIATLYGQEVPIASGGNYISYNIDQYPNQRGTVDSLADGAGGSFLDWYNRRDVVYKLDEVFTTYTSYSEPIIINGTNYGSGCVYEGNVLHDGSGWYYESGTGGNCSTYGSYITNTGPGSLYISTPVGDYTYRSWDDINYYHDGYGGAFGETYNLQEAMHGDYIGNDGYSGDLTLEVPDMSGNYFVYATYDSTSYYFDIYNTSYYTNYVNLNYYSYGTYITSDGNYNYYWDGYGGFYTESTGGGSSYPSYGEYAYSDGDYTYYHDGMGGTYSSYTGGGSSYPSYGEYAYNQDGYDYYHDGMGGYYTNY